MTSSRPSGNPTHQALPRRKVTESTAAVIPNTSEPPRPSQDFFGLIAGASGCLPNSTPAVYPPVSAKTTVAITAKTRPPPWSWKTNSALNVANNGTHVANNTVAEMSRR